MVRFLTALIFAAGAWAQTAEGELKPGESCRHNLGLAAGQAAFVRLERTGGSIHITVRAGERAVRELVSSGYSVAPIEMTLLAEAPAGYSLTLVNDGDPAAPVHYRLSIGAPRAASEEDKAGYAAEGALYTPGAKPPFEEAAARAETAAAFFRRSGARYKEMSAMRLLGNLYLGRQEFPVARKYYGEALALVKGTPWRFEEAVIRQNMSYAAAVMGEERAAIAELNGVLEIRAGLKDDLGRGIGLFGRGQAFWQVGELQRALDDYHASLAQFRKLGETRWAATVLNAMGLLYAELGRPETARADYAEAAAICRRIGDRNGLLMTINNLGLLKETQGLHREARADFEEVIAIAKELKDRRGQAYALQNLGDVSANEGDHARALGEYGASLDFKRELKDARAAAQTRRKMGLSYLALGRMGESRTVLEEALVESRAVSDRGGEAQSLAALARLDRAEGDPRKAEARIAEAVQLIETTRTELRTRDLRTSYFSTQSDFYDFAVDLAMDKGGSGASAALEWSERQRARSLLDSVRRGRADTGTAEPMADILTPAEIQRFVGGGTVLVEYSISPAHSYAWVVTSDRIRAVPLPAWARISAALQRLRKDVEALEAGAHPDGAELNEALAGVARVIWWPLDLGEGNTRVLIASSGGTQAVPFGALPATPAGPRVIERWEVASIPSASMVAALRRTPAAYPKRIAIFADPIFSAADLRIRAGARGAAEADELPRLRFSREEGAKIAALAGPDGGEEWLDSRATAASVRQAAAEPGAVLHLATHALVDGRDPASSRLVFARFDADGVEQKAELRLDDIYTLRLNRELVVLSACRTAAGPEVKGEGVLSLTRAFLYAGAKGVVANLWKVDDRASAELMRRFYRTLLAGGGTPAAALRMAQLEMLRDLRWNSVENWASFVFSGDWRIVPWGK